MVYLRSNLKSHFYVLVILVLVGSGCNVSKIVPEGQYLLDKNIIKTDRSELNEDVQAILKQKPNKKILGLFRFHLGVYRFATIGKETKFKNWVKTAIGEEPIILDSNLSNKSREQIEILFQNNGFFDVKVADSTLYRGKKRAKQLYTIESGTPYTLRNIRYTIQDSILMGIIAEDRHNSLLKPGKTYSNTLLQNERDRVTAQLRNHGFYNFNSQYIYYNVDSSINASMVDIWMVVSSPAISKQDTSAIKAGSLVHHKSKFNDIYVEVDYDPIVLQTGIQKDTTSAMGLKFISTGPLSNYFKAKHLSEHIFIRPDSLFSQSDLDLSYKRLSDLGVFRFINIRTEALPTVTIHDSILPLRCFILLAPQAKQELKLEAEGTNSGGNFGVVGNLTYRNRNIFKGAETLTIKIKGGLEIQQNFGDTTYESTRQLAIFNAYEIGPEISISFPRALWPFTIRRPKKVNNPSTAISTAFNTQNRPEYFRQLFNLSYYFTTKTTRNNRFFIYPAEINYLRVNLDPAFEAQLKDLNDPSIILGYSNQFIVNGRVSYLFNNQELSLRKPSLYFRTNLEFAGNSIYLTKRLSGEDIDKNNPSTLFNVKFAQYVRPDIDCRVYHPVGLFNATIVYRTAIGLGIPYGNSLSLPFEKSFYAGGPNDIRAWRTRQIGPGANKKEDYFERFGDFKITSNVEYRFDIFRKFKGAAFVDAGNIWQWRSLSDNDDGVFKLTSFADQIAIGAGLGLRFDFTFFVLRLDGAVQVKDPSKDAGERWTWRANEIRDITFNFGIGYPF